MMIAAQLKETRSKLVEFRRENDKLKAQLGEKQSILKQETLGGKALELNLMKMSISNDRLKEDNGKLETDVSNSERVKSKLMGLLQYVKSYTMVGNIRYRIKSSFVDDEEMQLNQDNDDDIVWESL